MPLKAFYSDHFVLPLPEGHRFPMSKYARLRTRVVEEGLVAADDLVEAPAASWDELRLAHAAPYVRAVATGTLPADMQRRIGFPWSPEMVERSRRSSGATIAAARVALREGVAANLAGGDRLGRLGLSIDGLQARDEYVFGSCLAARVPVVVVMSGGYAPDVEDIVRIHLNTIRVAAAHAVRWAGDA